MKGIVFKELIEMMESVVGEETTERVLEKANLNSGGAYTTVGTYDHSEILNIVTELSRETGTDAGILVNAFGKHLVCVFKKVHPDFFGKSGTFSFLKTVHDIIHVEVKKLYPDAELPTIKYTEIDAENLVVHYSSTRPFAALAEGLIQGVIEHYQENIHIETVDCSNGNGTASDFKLKMVA